ncbi:glycosyltransferase family 8 C-terminal domain-containing protein [Escherichia coli]
MVQKYLERKIFDHYFSNSPWKNYKRKLAPSSSEIRLKSKVFLVRRKILESHFLLL